MAGTASTNIPTSSTLSEFIANETIGGVNTTVRVSRNDVLGGIDSQISALQGAQSTTVVAYATLAELNANLTPAAGAKGEVHADPTPANNGVYSKSGASGSGSWTRIGDLLRPSTVILVQTNSDPNIIEATPIAGAAFPAYRTDALYLLRAGFGANTSTPSLKIGGLSPIQIANSDGSAISPERWKTNDTLVLRYVSSGATPQFLIVSPEPYFDRGPHYVLLGQTNLDRNYIEAQPIFSNIYELRDGIEFEIRMYGPNTIDNPQLSVKLANGIQSSYYTIFDEDGGTPLSIPQWGESQHVKLRYLSSIDGGVGGYVVKGRSSAISNSVSKAEQTANTALSAAARTEILLREKSFAGAMVSRTTQGTNVFASGVNTAAPWEIADYDDDGWFDLLTPTRLTVPNLPRLIGVRISTQIALSGALAQNSELAIYKNGSASFKPLLRSVNGSTSSALGDGMMSTGLIRAVPGDYFEAMVYQLTAGSLNYNADTNQSMFSIEAVFGK